MHRTYVVFLNDGFFDEAASNSAMDAAVSFTRMLGLGAVVCVCGADRAGVRQHASAAREAGIADVLEIVASSSDDNDADRERADFAYYALAVMRRINAVTYPDTRSTVHLVFRGSEGSVTTLLRVFVDNAAELLRAGRSAIIIPSSCSS